MPRAAVHLVSLLWVALAAGSVAANEAATAQTDALPEVAAIATDAAATAQTDALPDVAAIATDAVPLSARDILHRALENRFDLDALAEIEIRVRSRGGELDIKRARIASKRVDGLVYSFGRFSYPDELRDMAMLRLQNADRTDDFFAYIPEQLRVRRLAMPQRSDMFVGTDATYEDIERRQVDDYTMELSPSRRIDGEDVFVVVTLPHYDESGYERVDYLVAKSDFAIIEQHHYRMDQPEPFKIIRSPRAHLVEMQGHLVPMRIEMTDRLLGTITELRIKKIDINLSLPDSLFTTTSLSRERKLPRVK